MCLICSEQIPPSIELEITCKDIREIPALPEGIEILIISYCPELEKISNIPETVRVLRIIQCEKLEAVPPLPRILTEMYVNNTGILVFPPVFHTLLTEIFMLRTPVKIIPSLPPTIRNLSLNNSDIVSFSEPVYPSIEFLDCSHCKNLEKLPSLPNIRLLYSQSCEKLKLIGSVNSNSSIFCWNCPLLIADFGRKVLSARSPYVNTSKETKGKIILIQRCFRKQLFRKKIILRSIINSRLNYDVREYISRFLV